MPRWAIAFLSLVTAAAFATTAPAQTHDRGGRGEGGGGGGRGYGEGRAGPGPGWRGGVEDRGGLAPGWRGGGGRGGPAPWGRWEQGGGPQRWNEQRHNGYWLGSRWHYGPPPDPSYDAPGYRPGFAPWRRGGYLPPYYAGDVVADWDRFHLRRPPYGYHWVRVGDAYMLVSIESGLIFDIIEGF